MQNKQRTEDTKVIGLSFIGGMLELYDFAIYGIFVVYFAPQFFPADSHYGAVIQSYTLFLVGYLLRPVGGIIFSHLGDEYGRKKVLVATILLMGLSTLGIAALPTYAQIGVAAPVLLVLFRVIQGLALGGELPTAFVFLSESMKKTRILAFGVMMSGVYSGFLFAALIHRYLTEHLTQVALNEYGWRIPFAIGSIICLISYLVRQSLHETTAFRSVREHPRLPLATIFSQYRRELIIAIFLAVTQQICTNISMIYMPNYLKSVLNQDRLFVSEIMPICIAMGVVATFSFGYFFRQVQNIRNFLFFALFINSLVIPVGFFLVVSEIDLPFGYILIMIFQGLFAVIIPLYITQMFPVEVRLSGVALAYNLSAATFGGAAPLLISKLIEYTGQIYLAPVCYTCFFIALSALLLCRYIRLSN
ncbi:MFS transporter [Aquella oligotrophica]|nr:MFS transporter [Aquella oligotrophica]